MRLLRGGCDISPRAVAQQRSDGRAIAKCRRATPTKETVMNRLMLPLLAIAAVGCHERDQPLKEIPAAAIPDPTVERYRIPLDGRPSRGGDKPKVTIVEFSDFECPYCA